MLMSCKGGGGGKILTIIALPPLARRQLSALSGEHATSAFLLIVDSNRPSRCFRGLFIIICNRFDLCYGHWQLNCRQFTAPDVHFDAAGWISVTRCYIRHRRLRNVTSTVNTERSRQTDHATGRQRHIATVLRKLPLLARRCRIDFKLTILYLQCTVRVCGTVGLCAWRM